MIECRVLTDAFVCIVDEGYQRRVTVDDEDSTILVYDNWKQVSQTHTLTNALSSVKFA